MRKTGSTFPRDALGELLDDFLVIAGSYGSANPVTRVLHGNTFAAQRHFRDRRSETASYPVACQKDPAVIAVGRVTDDGPCTRS
jgi:hypothetical protein